MCKLTDLELLILEKPHASCEDFDSLLGDYVENEVSEMVREKLDDHLSECIVCQNGLALYSQVIDLAGDLGREQREAPMPSDVKRRLHEKLNASLGLKLSTSF
ncbi:MAG: zf-HC2 domain-containing protein [Bdellovibrionales bacterium]|nr:zf-HC2 domain-containing protein [Bdellovibrionales bacterium]